MWLAGVTNGGGEGDRSWVRVARRGCRRLGIAREGLGTHKGEWESFMDARILTWGLWIVGVVVK